MRFLSIALILVPFVALPGQDVTSRLEGRVRDAAGAGIADIRITVRSDALIGTRSVLTDAKGTFRFPGLPVGTYDVEIRRIGFRPVKLHDVVVRLGETSRVADISLLPAAQQLEEVLVHAETTLVDPSGTANRVAFPLSRVRTLPVGRDFRQLMMLAPMATPSFLGDEMNVAGATGYEHNYFVDGVNITSPIRGNTSSNLPYQFVQEMEIRTGGALASDAQALGAVVNVVTPSGGNSFRGEAFGFFSNDAMQSSPRLADGQYQSGFTFYDVGVRYSGPVMRDRIWFFTAYNPKVERREETYPFGVVADVRREQQFAGKITARVDDATQLAFTILGDPTRQDALGLAPLVFGVPQNAEVLQSKEITNDLALSLRLQRLAFGGLLEATMSQYVRREASRPSTAAGLEATFINTQAGTVSGGHGALSRYWGRSRVAELRQSWDGAAHSVTGGVRYEQLLNDMFLSGPGPWQGGEIFANANGTYDWHWFVSTESGRIVTTNPAAFIQDVWRASERLTVSAGVRQGIQHVDRARAGTRVLTIREGVQPRVGAVFRFDETGKRRLFGSYARVADQVAGWTGFQVARVYECGPITFAQDPSVDTTGGTAGCPPPYVGPPDSGSWNLAAQTTNEWSIGYEHRLPLHWKGTVRVLRRTLNDGVHNSVDFSTTPPTTVWGNPGRSGGALAAFPRPIRRYSALELNAERIASDRDWLRLSYVLSRNYGNNPGQYMSDWRVPSAHFGPLYIFPEQQVNAEGLLPNDRTHLFKAFGSRSLGSRLDVGASLVTASGTPLSEYGAISIPPPFKGFATQRGTAGRTPWLWDGGIRVSAEVPGRSVKSRVLFDVEHIGRRVGVDYEQLHYSCLAGQSQSCPNSSYGRVTRYSPPLTARLGFELGF